MILFIHGFRSCGLGQKSQSLIDYFGNDEVLAPDLPNNPKDAADALTDIINAHPIDLLIGSSLGGHLATYLNQSKIIPSVLINPAVAPHSLLNDYLGEHEDCHGNLFEVTQDYLEVLQQQYRHDLSSDERYLVLLQTGDETLDYRKAAAYYADFDVIVEQGGNHRFENFEKHLPHIAAWQKQHG